MVREKFHLEIVELKNKLVELGEMADKALAKSVEALETRNSDLALQVIEGDTKIDLLYEEINDFAILLIAKQAPVAIDLRRIIVAIKIATDIERIADFATNIAKATIRIGESQYVGEIEKIKEMYKITSEMLLLSLKAFREEDTAGAKHVAEMDDKVDDLYGEIISMLLKLNKEEPESSSQITQLSFVCRFLERAADHVTNIAENIFYLVKGRFYDLNE